jgi:hypothetical protein
VRKASRSILVAVVAACLLGASATVATAVPASTSRCDASSSGCHAAGPGATVAASLVSTSSTTANYNLAMTGSAGSGWAVFDGTTRLAGSTTAMGTFTAGLGKTYSVFAVDATFNSYVTTSVSPAAPAVETTASLDETIPPVTTSDAVGSYAGPATVKLTASDGEGQGIAYIYYSIDGHRVHLFTVGMVSQTSVTVAAPIVGTATHTIAFWSQDKAGNVEAHKTVTFTVAASPFTITKTVGANGSIDGNSSVDSGSDAVFTITPAAGYSVADVTVDGDSKGKISSYTFTNVTANHSISATFAKRPSWKVTLKLSKSSVKVNTKVKYSGTVRTSTGRAGSGVVTIQKRRASGGSWIKWRTHRLNASGNYSITVKMTKRQTSFFRAKMPGNAVNRTGYSAQRKLRVY